MVLCDSCDAKLEAGEPVPVFCVPCTTKKHLTPQRRIYIVMLYTGHMAGAFGFTGVKDFLYAIVAGKVANEKFGFVWRKKKGGE